jgi:predicted nucleotidyltransferase/DNA-binding XRE family transcriptional regulator
MESAHSRNQDRSKGRSFFNSSVAQNEMRKYNDGMNELERKRKELGITQAEAARALGVSRRTYQTYENDKNEGDVYERLLSQLDAMGVMDGSNVVLGRRYIEQTCSTVFSQYPEVECAYLFGSYARKTATGKSDVDVLIVGVPQGMKFFALGADLEDALHKTVDLHTYRELVKNEVFAKEILLEGVKIYGFKGHS